MALGVPQSLRLLVRSTGHRNVQEVLGRLGSAVVRVNGEVSPGLHATLTQRSGRLNLKCI